MKNSFFEKYLERSLILAENFKITCDKAWNELITINELVVQLGHVFSLNNPALIESGRIIDNYGDEISDVIFQLIILGNQISYPFKLYDYEYLKSNFEDFLIILGQLTESIMEKYNYRFKKTRKGFNDVKSFQNFKFKQLLDITFSIINNNGLDMEKEYASMLCSATDWLNKNYSLELK